MSDRVKEIEVPMVDRFGRNPQPKTVNVLPEHEDELRSYVEDVNEHAFTMLMSVLSISVLMVFAALLPAIGLSALTLPVVGGLMAAMGLILVRYPIATPETIAMLGMRRSRTTARWLGVATTLLGVGVGVLGI